MKTKQDQAPPWYQIDVKKDDDKTVEILIYEQIGEDWFGEGVSAKKFVEQINGLDVDYIQLRINSPGGNVFDATAIYNNLKAHKATVNVRIDGIAASSASVIAMAGDNIEMPENTMLMIHNPSALVVGTSQDMQKMADTLTMVKKGIVFAYKEKSKMKSDELSDLMDAETWISAKEAVKMGLADTVTEKVNIQASFDLLNKFNNVPQELLNSIGTGANNLPLKRETEEMEITIDLIRNDHPGIAKDLTDEGYRAGTEKGLEDGEAKGRENELARIKSVKDQTIPGHEDLINTLMFDGKTTGEQAAVQILAAEKVIREQSAQGNLDDGKNAKVPDVSTDVDDDDKIDANLPVEKRCQIKWDKSQELRAEFGDDINAYIAYQTAFEAGRIRVLKK